MTQEIDNNIPLSHDYSVDEDQWLYDEYESYEECPDLSEEELSEYAVMSLHLAAFEMKSEKREEDSYQQVAESGSRDEKKPFFSLRSLVTFNPIYELGKLVAEVVAPSNDNVLREDLTNEDQEVENKSFVEEIKELKSDVFPEGISVESVGDALKRGASHVYEAVVSTKESPEASVVDNDENDWCDEDENYWYDEDEYLYCWDFEEEQNSCDAEFYEESEAVSWWSVIEGEDAVCYDEDLIEEDDRIEIDDDDFANPKKLISNEVDQTVVVEEPSVYVVAPVIADIDQHNLFGANTTGFSAQTYSGSLNEASNDDGVDSVLPISFSMSEEDGCTHDEPYDYYPSEGAQSSLLASEEEATQTEELGNYALNNSEESGSETKDVILDAAVADVVSENQFYEEGVVEENPIRFVEDMAFLSAQATTDPKLAVSQGALARAATTSKRTEQQGSGGILTTNHTEQDDVFDTGMRLFFGADSILTEDAASDSEQRKTIAQALHIQESFLRYPQRIALAGLALKTTGKTTNVHDENMLFGQVMVHAGMLMFFTTRNQLGKTRVNNTLTSEQQSKEFYTVSRNSPTTGQGMQQEKQRHPQKNRVGKKKIVKNESKQKDPLETFPGTPLTSYHKPIDIIV
ncbi:MAG: hypothetical protein ABII18_13340 [bacterium]|nr:hypothetical protein [bacterium]MBU1916705.1 hypothetical protein [bacterium]